MLVLLFRLTILVFKVPGPLKAPGSAMEFPRSALTKVQPLHVTVFDLAVGENVAIVRLTFCAIWVLAIREVLDKMVPEGAVQVIVPLFPSRIVLDGIMSPVTPPVHPQLGAPPPEAMRFTTPVLLSAV